MNAWVAKGLLAARPREGRRPSWLRALKARAALLVLAPLVALFAGCAAERPRPTPLEPVTPRIAGRIVWQVQLPPIGFPLSVAARDGRFFAATDDGTVISLQADTGRVLWRTQVGGRIAAGVGSDGRFSAVVTRENQLVVLDGERVVWRTVLPGRVLTAPLVAGGRVFVLSVDRSVQAHDVIDGRQLWRQQRAGDPLTLAQAGVLQPHGNQLIVGLGPRLVALDPLQGTVRWEVPLAAPRGTNEVERLADLVGPAVRVGNRICARAFQAALGCVDAERRTLAWSRPFSGSQAVAADERVLVAAGSTDRLTAWRQDSGSALWSSDRFLHRGLSGGLIVGPAAIFADQEGQVHFLDKETGVPLLRLGTDASAPVGAPVLADTTVLIAKRSGMLVALRPQ